MPHRRTRWQRFLSWIVSFFGIREIVEPGIEIGNGTKGLDPATTPSVDGPVVRPPDVPPIPLLGTNVQPVVPPVAHSISQTTTSFDASERDLQIARQLETLGDDCFHFTNRNWKIFYRFFSRAERTIDIATNRMSAEQLELLFSSINPDVAIRILVGHTPRGWRRIKDFLDARNPRGELFICRDLHGKFCVRDDNTVLLGSSNMVRRSLGNLDGPGNFEADIISDDHGIVSEAKNLFDYMWNGENPYRPVHNDTCLLSSLYGLPNFIIDQIRTAQSELVIFSSNFANREIIRAIRELNKEINIKVVLNWPSSSTSEENIKALNLIRDARKDGRRLYSLRPKRQPIHAKIYLFDQRVAVISSLNLTTSSWGYMYETGLVTSDRQVINKIVAAISEFDRKEPDKIRFGYGGNGQPPPVIEEEPDVKYMPMEPEGQKLIPMLRQLSEQFVNEYGADFAESSGTGEESEHVVAATDIRETATLHPGGGGFGGPGVKIISTPPTGNTIMVPPDRDMQISGPIVVVPTPSQSTIPSPSLSQEIIYGPYVVGGNGQSRRGRGYSIRELIRSGLDQLTAPRCYRLDRRRKSCHARNVDMLINGRETGTVASHRQARRK